MGTNVIIQSGIKQIYEYLFKSATRPILIEVPHFASLRDKEREICILRSDNGETWHEHGLSASDDAVHEALDSNFNGAFSFYAGILKLEEQI